MATIALDIGGTKIAGAIFLPDGTMVVENKQFIEARAGAEVGELAAGIVKEMFEEAAGRDITIEGVGVCVPGIVYSRTNLVWAPNIPGWDNYPLYDDLCSVIPDGVPLHIDSDRTCHMYGEMWLGAAKECHSAIFIAVGTGIGAGIIMDGRVIHGANDTIGATGWMALEPPYKEEFDACGCFEYYASGNGIGARARDAVRSDSGYNGVLRNKPVEEITAHDVFEAYKVNDPIAVAVLKKAVMLWGMAAANMVSLLNPQKIIWGGGVFGPASIFIEDIYKEACKWAQPISIRQVEFVHTQVPGNAGLLGAAFLPIKNKNYEERV